MATGSVVRVAVESGTSGNWSYKKFADGFCVLRYYDSSYNAVIATAKGSIYSQADNQALNYPFPVYGASGDVSARADSNAIIPWVGNITFYESSLRFRLFNPTSVTSNVTLTVGVYGRWK